MTSQPKPKLPTKGGSFIREEDGSLRQMAGTAPKLTNKPAPAKATGGKDKAKET